MAMAQKSNLYAQADAALFGGNLPAGAKPAGAPDPELAALKQAQADCRAAGGQWDPVTKSCIMPKAPEAPLTAPPTANVPKGTVETFTNNETGRASGVVLPDGRTFLGLNPNDINKIAAGEANKVQMPLNSSPVGTAQASANQQMQVQQAISQIGAVNPNIGLVRETPIDFGQAMTAGVANVPSLITNIATGAAGGAAAGSVIPGVGTVAGGVAGGVAGAIKGVWGGVTSNIAKQQRGEIAASVDVLTSAKTNMRQLSVLAANDPANAGEYVQAFNYQKQLVYQAQRKIKAETTGNLNKFTEDGTDILSDFDLFLGPGGAAEIYGQKLSVALQTGVPPVLTEGDLPQ